MRQDVTGLWTDKYEFTMAQAYVQDNVHERPACFDYFFRKMPFGGGYVVFAGLGDVLKGLEAFRFDDAAIDFLRDQNFSSRFLDYLSDFRFGGTVHAAREGEIVFANEPVLRVEGTLLEAQLVETLILNILNFQSLIATKAARMRYVAGPEKILSDFGFRRAHGAGGLAAARAAIVGGFNSTSNMVAAQQYDLAASGTMAHSFVQSYDDELTAFRVFAASCPEHCVLLVDTYDTLNSGLPNAIRVAKEMEARKQKLLGIRLDSGDLAYMATQSRTMLDQAGLAYVKIAASSQLDEHLIRSLLQQNAPIDLFGVGTQLVIGAPDAALDGIYKLSMSDDKPRLKISDSLSKVTLPGIKKIIRYADADGLFQADAIVLNEEGSPGRMYHPAEPLKSLDLSALKGEEILLKAMDKGRIVEKDRSAAACADYVRQRFAQLPAEHKRFENPHIYKVGLSRALKMLRDDMISHYRGNAAQDSRL